MIDTVAELISIFLGRGAESYFGEPVSVTEHSLQTAHLAQCADASAALVLAALLHDIGHLIELAPDEIADWRVDGRHELTGSAWLASRFGPEVSEPVRLHVAAKRYLCAVGEDYLKTLSPASVVTLGLQGGPLSRSEAAALETEPYFWDAIRLRRWDDEAKVAGLATAGLEHYRTAIESLARSRG
jgi:phosphonate degradation associated HDIG domain protein